MILPLTIWNFPIWVTHYFNGEYFVGSIWCIYWYKAFLVLVTVGIAYEVTKILDLFAVGRNKKLIASVLIVASPELLLSIGYAGQDEVVFLLFSIIALRAYLENKGKKFWLFSFWSVMCCTFMILPFLVLFVLKEKRILRIVCGTVIMFLPNILWSIITLHSEGKEGIQESALAF